MSTMLAVIAPKFTKPTGYQVTQVPRPTVTEPDDVVIQVRAASVNPIDVKNAAGHLKLAIPERSAFLRTKFA
jgi:NADPH:quinone reductase-like Zn-dependent oxidoreductase